MNRKSSNSRLVYSTDKGRVPPQNHRQEAGSVGGNHQPTTPGDGVVRLQLQKKGRGGKAVTVISGLPLPADQLKATAKNLKKRCGVGGAVKGNEIEIQGDQRNTLQEALAAEGYTVKLSGG